MIEYNLRARKATTVTLENITESTDDGSELPRLHVGERNSDRFSTTMGSPGFEPRERLASLAVLSFESVLFHCWRSRECSRQQVGSPGFEPEPDVLAPSGRRARLAGFESVDERLRSSRPLLAESDGIARIRTGVHSTQGCEYSQANPRSRTTWYLPAA